MRTCQSISKTTRIFALVFLVLTWPLLFNAPAPVHAERITALQVENLYTPTTSISLPLVWQNYHWPNLHLVSYLLETDYQNYQWDMRTIQAPAAWDLRFAGGPLTSVAVVDTGVQLDHPDLAANLLPGYDFVQNDAIPEDGNGHGTHVAGVIAAAVNGKGILGVAPFATVIPVRVLDNNGNGTASTVAAGILWAAEHARIINLSLGSENNSSLLADAINTAVTKHGCLVIAATGNDGRQVDYYPASYPGVLGVGAIDASGNVASFSNTGPAVDVVAPGVNIYSTYTNGEYRLLKGTSMATPHVAGLAALIWENHPEYSAMQVANLIEATTLDISPEGHDLQSGYGMIRVDRAMAYVGTPPITAAAAGQLTATSLQPSSAATFVAGRVVVKFRDGVSTASQAGLNSILAQASSAGQVEGVGAEILKVPVGQELQVAAALQAQPGVEYAEPDYIYSAQ